MARLIKECEWKLDVNGFAREKVVRHVELFDKPSHGSQHCLPQSTVLLSLFRFNISTVHIGILRTIHECKWISANEFLSALKEKHVNISSMA
jgi:hypothetical protein